MKQLQIELHHTDGSLAKTLACAIDGAGKPRRIIARELEMHRNTLARIARGERQIGLDAAARIFEVCGVPPHSTMLLALSDQADLAEKWMHLEFGEFLEAFIRALPGELDHVLGDRIGDIRPRWALGASRLVAKLLAQHVDEIAARDISLIARR